MNNRLLIKETARLAKGVKLKLLEIGCYHRIKDGGKLKKMTVPTEGVCYDPRSGLIWTELHISRLPRGYTVEKLRERGLAELLTEYLQRPIVLAARKHVLSSRFPFFVGCQKSQRS